MPSFTFQSPHFQPAFFTPKAVRMGAVRYDAASWPKVMSIVMSALAGDFRFWGRILSILEDSAGIMTVQVRLCHSVESENENEHR